MQGLAYLRNCGFDTQLVEVKEDGTIEENAAFIAEAVRKETSDGKRLIIVSTSIGEPETAVALGKGLEFYSCVSRSVSILTARRQLWTLLDGQKSGSPLIKGIATAALRDLHRNFQIASSSAEV